jgi:hypothetical protein
LCAIRCPTDAMTMEKFTLTERLVPSSPHPPDAGAPTQVGTK